MDAFGQDSERALRLAYLNSKFETGIRSPLDTAILQNGPRTSPEYCRNATKFPSISTAADLSVVVEHCDGAEGIERLFITKGAPEGVLGLCDSYEERRPNPGHVESETREQVRKVYEGLCEKGFRVLAVASRQVDRRDGFSAADEQSLILAGFLAFEDPPSPDAAHALVQMKRDGIEVKILTGDNELVARHICAQVGLEDPYGRARPRTRRDDRPGAWTRCRANHGLRARHANAETAHHAGAAAARTCRRLHRRRHQRRAFAARGGRGDFGGDSGGRRARCGGHHLLKRGLGILHRGIIEGRKASGNVLKYLLMDTSSNFGNMFSMAGASLFLPFLPMLSTQILLNNFCMTRAQIAIPTDNVDEDYLRGPQRWDMRLIRNFMIFVGPISSLYDFLTFYVLLHFFHAVGSSLSHGLVRGIARHADAGAVCHSHEGKSAEEPAEPMADFEYACGGRGGTSPSVVTFGRASRVYTLAVALLCVSGTRRPSRISCSSKSPNANSLRCRTADIKASSGICGMSGTRHSDSSQRGAKASRWLRPSGIVGSSGVAIFGPRHWTAGRTFLCTWRVAVGGIPLVCQLRRNCGLGEFGSDFLAGVSIVTAVLLREYLVAAIVVLMLSGGTALEEFATRRASHVLDALAKRMPSIAHRKAGEGLVGHRVSAKLRRATRSLSFLTKSAPWMELSSKVRDR